MNIDDLIIVIGAVFSLLIVTIYIVRRQISEHSRSDFIKILILEIIGILIMISGAVVSHLGLKVI